MRYEIRQKLLCVGDDFIIKDEKGRDAYLVDGYGFSIGNRFSFQDSKKREILNVSQVIGSFTPKYKIKASGRKIALISKALLSFRNTFHLSKLPSGEQIQITGKLLENEYQFHQNGHVLATVSKKWFRATDSYAVDIQKGSEHALILAAAIVVDLTCHDHDSKHKRKGRATG
jgi:uncharacterized protein YxjI